MKTFTEWRRWRLSEARAAILSKGPLHSSTRLSDSYLTVMVNDLEWCVDGGVLQKGAGGGLEIKNQEKWKKETCRRWLWKKKVCRLCIICTSSSVLAVTPQVKCKLLLRVSTPAWNERPLVFVKWCLGDLKSLKRVSRKSWNCSRLTLDVATEGIKTVKHVV